MDAYFSPAIQVERGSFLTHNRKQHHFFSERETSALQLTGSGTSPVLSSSSSSSSAPARLVPSAGDVCALLTIETVRVLCVCVCVCVCV